MFGYVRVYKPELKIGEYEQYQGVYCSLCKQLGRSCGQLSRMTLSYDFTFLALLRMALDDTCPGFHRGRCFLHPFKKRTCCRENDHIAFAADAAALLTYYKLLDNLKDSGFLRRLALRFVQPFVSSARRRARRRQPRLDEEIQRYMERQTALERARTPSVDAAAEPSARLLSYLAQLSARNERDRLVLDRLGYCLGRWIYLIDAVDDLADDLKENGYNPYIFSRGLKQGEDEAVRETREYALLTLNACLAECLAAYHLLPVRRFDGILRNILEQGMPAAQRLAVQGGKRVAASVPDVQPPAEPYEA
ncbi:MAG: hypothetical protein HFJ80_05830 [Clostridiales bacterium]|nr:hypothetical protein [Clostridiales bacterium]